ncbi:nucleoside triphosphate pyrophosphohydrolase [Paenibacillus sp. y28]|uniref:nucleoside triphosphate pyrophosphohydrolase n=1 Tax=Paenibacillus sp. y28 TaxID=3129110 RepID=UPI0030188494
MTASITVVGLGTGDASQLTLGVWNKISTAGSLYLRTADHPVVQYLQEQQVAFSTFDTLYKQHESFAGVYEAIVEELIAAAGESGTGDIVYAVPGHPMVAEYTAVLLRERCPQQGIPLHFLGGESFLDQAFLRFGFDPIEGFILLDATALQHAHINPRLHTIIGQVYDALTASDVKLTLMEWYPEDAEVVVGHALGVAGREHIQRVPLLELDRMKEYGNLSLIWVPARNDDAVLNRSFERLREIVELLRSPDGCPWDREQTHLSIRKNLIEEAYEVLETLDDDDPDAMCEELGDLLLQIMLHSQMEAETGAFHVYDVVRTLNEKLIRRHPHVFGETAAQNAEEALRSWQAIKAEEKQAKGIDTERQSVLAGVPRDLPALLKAAAFQKKAAKVGFDWDSLDGVIGKVEEELLELKEAVREAAGSRDEKAREHSAEELGDLLFSVVNIARFLEIDPELALTQCNNKFQKRFLYIEEKLRLNGKSFEQTDIQEMEKWWQEAKNF